jgi:hypothetical protein
MSPVCFVKHLPGTVLHPLAHAREVLAFYRDFVISGLPDDLIVYVAALSTPDGHPVIALLPAAERDDFAHVSRKAYLSG